MKRLTLAMAILALAPLAALAQQFGVGQHVLIGTTGETGTILHARVETAGLALFSHQ